MIREAFLAATMNLVPAAPLDVLRYLRVPAIVWVMPSWWCGARLRRACRPKARRRRAPLLRRRP